MRFFPSTALTRRGVFFLLATASCQTVPRFNKQLIRPWIADMGTEISLQPPFLADFKQGKFRLYYLAAKHETDPQSETLKVVDLLFQRRKFDALIIEPLPFSFGKNPNKVIERSIRDNGPDIVVGGESTRAVVLANKAKIPFWGGEIDHSSLFRLLRSAGYSTKDIVGFYLVRQIPQWRRDGKLRSENWQDKSFGYLQAVCHDFLLKMDQCPSLKEIVVWYTSLEGKELGADVDSEETAPLADSPKALHRLSTAVNRIRDQYTLDVIGKLLRTHSRVAVVYGAGHFQTLRLALVEALGNPRLLSLDQLAQEEN